MGFSVLSDKDTGIILALGEMILGYTPEELGDEFVKESDQFLGGLDEFLQSDLKRLLKIINSPVTNFLFTGSFRSFVKQPVESRRKLYNKFVYSKISLLRTGSAALRALCGWSLYSLDMSWKELNHPGITIGREDETPTLLFGKEKWREGMEL
ncbi:MAG: hypothetical protein ACXAE3_05825 [Candidatus Kariarchaeaceae archaeon]|jgi:hypothetical protein